MHAADGLFTSYSVIIPLSVYLFLWHRFILKRHVNLIFLNLNFILNALKEHLICKDLLLNNVLSENQSAAESALNQYGTHQPRPPTKHWKCGSSQLSYVFRVKYT